MSDEDLEKARAIADELEARPGALTLVEAARLMREMCDKIEHIQEPSF